MYFGIKRSVLIGRNILGKVSFRSAPISEISKKRSSFPLIAASVEEPILPRPEISKFSAPLNTFLINSEPPNPIPNFWILLCDTSKSNPSEYFGCGVKKILAIRSLRVESAGSGVNCTLGYLKIRKEFKRLYVLEREMSL